MSKTIVIAPTGAVIGDDVYLKAIEDETGTIWPGATWGDDVLAGAQLSGLAKWRFTIDELTIYAVLRNSHSATFTADSSTDTLTSTGHGLTTSYVVLAKGSDLPAPLVMGTRYYVINPTTDTLQLSLTDGGAAIDLTDNGSGAMSLIAYDLRSSSDTIPDLGTIDRESDPVTLVAEGEQVSRARAIELQTTAEYIRAAVGLAIANLDTQLAGLLTQIGLIGSNQSSVTNVTTSSDSALDFYLAKDMSFNITASTSADSRLIFAARKNRAQTVPDIRIDTTTGLLLVKGVDSPTADDGSVTRVSDSQVAIYLRADAWDHLDDGTYWLDLTEITDDGRTILRYCNMGNFVRSAGRVMAS